MNNTQVSMVQILIEEVHTNAREHGFWDGGEKNIGEAIALIHSELSEGLEAARKELQSDHIPEFSGLEEELADVIIRVFDLAGGMGLRVGEAMQAKAAFNKTRPYRHGAKF